MNPTHIIIHTIQLKPGVLDQVKALFEDKVPQLAQRFSAWCGARLTFNKESNVCVTIGSWADEKQMQEFLSQPGFAQAMEGFSEFFAAPPQTTITEVVTAVGPNS